MAFHKNKSDKNSLRVAMLGHKRIPSREGGVEVVVEQLAVRLVRKGLKVTCYNRGGKATGDIVSDRRHLKEYEGVRVRTVPTIDRSGLAAVSSSFFATLFSCFGPYDLVHVHAEGPSIWTFLLKLFGKKVVVTVHGLDHQRAKWGRFASFFIWQGEKNAVRFADQLIVLNEETSNYFLEKYGRKTVIIPNAATPPVHRGADVITKKFGITKDSYFLSLGRIVPEKGLHTLIAAYKKLDTDKKLVIAGAPGGTESYLASLKEQAAGDDRIIFTGFVQGKRLEELFSNAYAFVMPSELEGMPIALLEAMSYGNACLVSDIPECAKVLGSYGEVFKNQDRDSLTEKLDAFDKNPALVEKYRRNVAEYCLSHYNWDDIVEKTLETYKSIC